MAQHPHPTYRELRAATAFSFLDGASLPETLADAAAGLDLPSMAIVDRDGFYSAPRFHLAARKAGLRAHIGVEISSALACTGRDPNRTPLRRTGHIALLAATREGYGNLCRLITEMKLGRAKGSGFIDEKALDGHTQGIICLTGGEEGPLTRAIPRHAGQRTLERLIGLFGPGNVYVELQRHLDRDEDAINRRATELAESFKLPIVATNGVRYATPRDREILDVFTCIRKHKNLETAGQLLQRNAERHLKSASEMAHLFRDLPEAIANTVELASRLEFTLDDRGYEFPRYPVPGGGDMATFLRERTEEGALQRFQPYDDRSRRQIERELKLIVSLGLEGYFLIVWDLVKFCRENSILAQGRGSAANSAACYALGITAVDPVKMDLLFERFLSEERGEWPDIDLDLPSGAQRERVIQYVYQRYGERGAAMTANVITYRGRSAAREAGKALCFDPASIDRLASLMSRWEYQDDADTLNAQFLQAGLNPADPRIARFVDLCGRLQDLPRHLGQHSGGMIVCQGQLDSVVPLEPATMPGRVVAQWDKDDCAAMGIVKIDLLGLGMMAVLEDSIALIREHQKEDVDLAHLPENDPVVYRTLQKADTIGMFQIESRAQMSCLPRLKPERFYDLVAQVAIIRPGPIVGNMLHPYLKRRQGREPVRYPHPSLQPALERTLGVPLFQEQLLRIAMVAAGFTGGEAEELRRAFTHKRSDRKMREIEDRLRSGMEKNGITGPPQDEIVGYITSFAQYGFPESHAASFALIAYASAYLKCHYLAAFTAAILNNQPMGFYSPATLVKDAQRHGLKVKPIDVTRSSWPCTMEGGDAVRLGLRYIHGLRETAAVSLVRERKRKPFTSIEDLTRRVPELRKPELVTLANAGALNFLDSKQPLHRRDALWQVERAARRTGPLLDSPDSATESDAPSPLDPMTSEERVVADFHTSGVTTGPHPMAYHRTALDKRGVLRTADLERITNGTPVRVAGAVIARQRPSAAKGFVFLSLEDETGVANAILTPQAFERHRSVILSETFLLLEGRLQNQDGAISIKVSRATPLHASKAAITSHDFH